MASDAHKINANTTAPTVDEFYRGRLRIYQPNDGGHKAGLDALLLAASVPEGAKGALIDLGAGTGVAGLAAACRAPNLEEICLVELNQRAGELLSQSVDELLTKELAQKTDVEICDVRALQIKDKFDFALCNPPFNDQNYRVSPNENRALAHQLTSDMELADWLVCARRLLKAGGQVSMIFRPENLPQILPELTKGFGAIKIFPILPKAPLAAKRLVVTAIKGRKTALEIMPSLVMHEADGAPTLVAQRIFDGGAI